MEEAPQKMQHVPMYMYREDRRHLWRKRKKWTYTRGFCGHFRVIDSHTTVLPVTNEGKFNIFVTYTTAETADTYIIISVLNHQDTSEQLSIEK